MQPIIQVRGLNKSFGSLKVADDISLDIAAGEAVGILGPNGAGKSTLFNLIAGTLAPSSGAIFLKGTDVTHFSTSRRCHLGIGRSFQIPHPFVGMSVYENLLVAAFFGNPTRHDADRACKEILDKTGLRGKANTPVSGLGLLQRKRLELARALATNPQVLLLDEIAGGLTRAECDELVSLIRDLHSSGITIVWIEHIVHALTQVVGRFLVLDRGRLIADGPGEQVMAMKSVLDIYMGVETDDNAAA